jgi:hypothetical protein
MYTVKCKLQGLVPMMMDRFFNPEELGPGGSKKKGKDAWKKELPLKLHADKKGVYVPVDSIRMMLIGNTFRPGAAKIIGSYIEKGKATQYVSFCKGCVWVVGLEDPLKVYVKPERKTYDDYDERSFPNAAGSRSLARRPLITTPWSLAFHVQVTDEQYDPDKMKEFFDVAGLRCGCGAYGPTFGRFVVEKWEVVKK